MVIESLKIVNFRNYKNQEVEFSNNTNIVYGKNAQGKTNLVEPLYILSTLKSFRNSKLVDCINENSDKAIIEAVLNSEIYGKRKIRYVLNRDGENEYYVNENKIKQKKDMTGNCLSVVFSPDELKIIKGGPEVRREFLDLDIAQVSKIYLELLERYEEILTARNKLLKNSFKTPHIDLELDVWDEQLSYVGSQITITRSNFLTKINEKVQNIMLYLSKGKEKLDMKYVCIGGETRQEKTENLLKALKDNRQRDKELGYTSVGPHRDDVKFFINDKEVKPFASQGQQRSVILALKLAELETIEAQSEIPILILDDVFSELDLSRQFMLLEYLKNNQIFITTTVARTKGIENFKKIHIVDGCVRIK